MYGAILNGRAGAAGMIAVRTHDDIGELIKEAEVITGKAGRRFVVAGGDRLAFVLSVGPFFFEVTDLTQEPPRAEVVMTEDFERHVLGAALNAGKLFTPAIVIA